MAKVDTILASGDVTTGNGAPRQGFQTAEDMEAGAKAIQSGADQAITGIRMYGRERWVEQQRLKEQQKYNNQLYVEGQMTQAQRDWTQWSNDVQKKGSEDVVDEFNTKYPKYQEDMVKQAPNDDAKQMLTMRLNELGTHVFGNSLKIEAANRAQNTVNTFSGMLQTNTDTIAQDPESYTGIQKRMNAFLDGAHDGQRITPEVEAKLRDGVNQLGVVAAENTIAKDPDRAKEIIDGQQGIDWPQRKKVEEEIERSRTSNDALFQYQQKNLLDSNLQSIRSTGVPASGFDRGKFLSSVDAKDPEKNAVTAAMLDTEVDKAKQTYVGVQSLQGKSPGEIGQILTQMHPPPGDPKFSDKMDVWNQVAQAADQQQKLFNRDPFVYSRQDPIVNKAWKMVEDLPPDAMPGMRAQITQQALEASVNFQKSKGVLDSKLSVMPNDAATQIAQKINGGDLKTVQDTLDGMKSSYGRFYPQAFRDLVSLPEGQRVDAATQVVALQSGKPFLSDFLGAVRTPDKDMKVEPKDKSLIDDKLITDPTMLSFKNAMTSANPGAITMTGEFSDAVGKYAQSLLYRGKVKNAADAVTMASNQVIGTAYGFTSIGGTPLAVKRQQGGVNYSDNDVKDIGSALQQFQGTIDPAKVDSSKFWFPENLSADTKSSSVKRTLTNDSFWVTNPQNDGAQLYMNGANGTSAPVKWADGRQVEGKFQVLLNLAKTNQQIEANDLDKAVGSPGAYGPF